MTAYVSEHGHGHEYGHEYTHASARGIRLWTMLVGSALWLFSAVMVQAGQVVVVVLDDSGSMRNQMRTEQGTQSRMEAAKMALSKVVVGLPTDAQIGIFALNQGGRGSSWIVPIGPIDPQATLQRIRRINANGGTPLGAGLKVAADALLEARQRLVYGDFRLLVITDGEATDPELLASYLPDILARGITLDVIGVDMRGDHSLASRAHSYRRADDAESFEKALREVFAESSSLDASDPNAQLESDFEVIAGLPDDDTALEVLAALAIPDNQEIHHAADASNAADSTPVDANTQPVPTPPMVGTPATGSGDPIIAVLTLIPCCFSLLIFFLVIVFAIRGLTNKSKSRRR